MGILLVLCYGGLKSGGLLHVFSYYPGLMLHPIKGVNQHKEPSFEDFCTKVCLSFKFVFHGSLSSVKGRLSSCKGWSHKSTISSYQWRFNGINSFWSEWIFHQHDLRAALNLVWPVWVPLPIPCIPHIHHGLLELHCGSWAGIPKNLTISAKWKYLKYQKYND